MPNPFRVMTVFGTRPEAIKMAPLIQALEKHPDAEVIVAVTAQHREMLDQVLNLFSIHPRYDLNIMSVGQTLSEITSRVLLGMDKIFSECRPDIVLIHGDTTTSFAAALSAFYHKIPVGHVEAGLRTWNKYSPFPEEINRSLSGVLCDLHFAPTQTAKDNLLSIGIPSDKIFITGNTVIDALMATIEPDFHFYDGFLKGLDRKKRNILLTCHRRENLGEPMKRIFSAIEQVVERNDGVEIIFPMHKNNEVRKLALDQFADNKNIHLIEPLEYKEFSNLMNMVSLILTDSGGIQEEALSLGKPVIVLRDTTERREALTSPLVELVGTQSELIIDKTEYFLNNLDVLCSQKATPNPFGDGHASERIVEELVRFFLCNRDAV